VCSSGAIFADTERIVRVEHSGVVVPAAAASYVDGLVAWRDGAAWIADGSVWCVASPGAAPTRAWESEHMLRELVAVGDQLAVIALGCGDHVRSVLWLG
jgi:hypothetical protein